MWDAADDCVCLHCLFKGGLRPSYCVNIFSLDLYAFSMILELGIAVVANVRIHRM